MQGDRGGPMVAPGSPGTTFQGSAACLRQGCCREAGRLLLSWSETLAEPLSSPRKTNRQPRQLCPHPVWGLQDFSQPHHPSSKISSRMGPWALPRISAFQPRASAGLGASGFSHTPQSPPAAACEQHWHLSPTELGLKLQKRPQRMPPTLFASCPKALLPPWMSSPTEMELQQAPLNPERQKASPHPTQQGRLANLPKAPDTPPPHLITGVHRSPLQILGHSRIQIPSLLASMPRFRGAWVKCPFWDSSPASKTSLTPPPFQERPSGPLKTPTLHPVGLSAPPWLL